MKAALHKGLLAISFLAACLSLPAWADDHANQDAAAKASITKAMMLMRPDWKVMGVRPVGIEGLYEVRFQGGILLYATADGRYVIDGDIYEVAGGQQVSLTEQVRQDMRAERLAAIKREDMVIFSPKPPQAVKAAMYVFTDVDCGYCQLLHREVPQLNSMGIEVRYLAWPRGGFDSETYRKMVTVWCADDPRAAMTKMKNREMLPMNLCDDNPVAEQFLLGQELGIRGTPALIFEDGQLQPGYIPAAQLAPLLLKASAR